MQVNIPSSKKFFFVLFVVTVCVIGYSPVQSDNLITGSIFIDYNANGVRDTHEPNVAGLIVTAYRGILASTRGPVSINATNQIHLPIIMGDGNGGPVTAVTDSKGKFRLETTPGQYRLEVTGLPSHIFEGAAGLTTVVFVNHGDSEIEIGVNDPTFYSQSNPDVVANQFTNGLPDNDLWPTKALVTFSYNNTGTTPEPVEIARKNEIGATWGLAYQRGTGVVYSAAFLKRHVGLLETDPITKTPLNNPLAAIYATDVESRTSKLFVDLSTLGINVGTAPNNAERILSADPMKPQNDAAVFDMVGKVGLGDMDISSDDSTLWVTNLYQKSLLAIAINPDSSPGETTSFNIPTSQCNGSGAANDARPFAVKAYRGKVYVGVTCSAENTQKASDMHAYVFRLDDNTFTSIVDFALDYNRGYVWNMCPDNAGWFPWTSEWPAICATTTFQNMVIYPQPQLSDIEFDDDGSLILSFLDRFGHQGGWFNYAPTGTTAYNTSSGGDIRRACYVSGEYVVEGSDPSCPQQSQDQINFEYYIGDNDFSDGVAQKETGVGGLALLNGSGEVAMSAKDPIGPNSNGMITLFNLGSNWGEKANAYQVVERDNASGFGKAHGIGDLELLINPAPLEIGNRLWCDGSNGYAQNGIQDPGEFVVGDGTEVRFECDTDGNLENGYEVSATTQTKDGNYLFIDNIGDVTLANAWPTALWDSSAAIIPRNAECRILIDPQQSGIVDSCGDGGPTIANNGGGDVGSDLRDSDGAADHDGYGNVGTTFNTGDNGQNDHTFDFGFIPQQEQDWGDLPDSYHTSSANDGANHVITGLVLGDIVDAEISGPPTESADGDNVADQNDEDGVTFISTGAVPSGALGWHDGPDGAMVQIDYPAANAGACLNAWIDWSRDGSFDLANEYVIIDNILDNGTSETYAFTVPDGTFDGSANSDVNIYGRFRLTQNCNDYSLTGGNSASPSGAALNGEVEDYRWLFTPTAVALFNVRVSHAPTADIPVAMASILLFAGITVIAVRRRW